MNVAIWRWIKRYWGRLLVLGIVLAMLWADYGSSYLSTLTTPEDLGVRLTKECRSIVRAGGYDDDESMIKNCVLQRGLGIR